MLKFRLNRNQIFGGLQPVNVITHDARNMPPTNGEVTQSLLVCYCDTVEGLSVGSSIMCRTDLEQSIEGILNSAEYHFTQFHTISGIDTVAKSFSTIINKYMNLPIARIYVTQDEDSLRTAHIIFEESHYFSNVKTDGKEDEEENQPILHIRYKDEDGLTLFYDIPIDGEIVKIESRNIIGVVLDKTQIDVLGEFIKYIDSKAEVPTIGWFEKTQPYVGEVPATIFTIGRELPMFAEKAGYQYFFEKATKMLPLSLQNSNQFGLTQDLEIASIASTYKQKVINPITDVERDIYHPVFRDKDGSFLPIYKIKFNLHFRQHRGDNWLVENSTFWNGTGRNEENKVVLLKDLPSKNSEGNNKSFFSTNTDEEGFQSDLLTYLNFTNSDVKFQKSRLKKSFLRLGFYDSDDVNEQMLLATSTIFMNAGDVFTKQVRHLNTQGYYSIDKDDNEATVNLTGAKVDREITRGDLTNEEVEDRRLSCQFVVQDRDNSMSSSEGFYLYLLKSMETGEEPKSVYLRIEFNHAGYGITSPMMMPYVDPKKHNGDKGIKSFGDILKDWNGEGDDKPYGIKQYLKFIHLKFKYQYDPKGKRFVYYLDDEIYGSDKMKAEEDKYGTYDEATGCLTINLYEAKIATDQEIDDIEEPEKPVEDKK